MFNEFINDEEGGKESEEEEEANEETSEEATATTTTNGNSANRCGLWSSTIWLCRFDCATVEESKSNSITAELRLF